jgi:hypothetical protein
MSNSTLYDLDFYAWANEQAGLLRAGKLSEADLEHIAAEIESMGKTEKRELANRLTVLLLHLLKWQFQPERRGKSWNATIRVQRREMAEHMRDNPSLKAMIPQAIALAYGNATIEAEAETDLPEATFPSTCPWSFEQITAPDFWPSAQER